MRRLEVFYVDIENVIPYENNPRINDDAVEKVANSIREFGWQQPIVVDKHNVIIVGHTRLKAAKMLGEMKVPVVFADLSEGKAKAYRLADNRTGQIAEFDFELLEQELDELNETEPYFDMSDFGFEEEFDDIDYLDAMEEKFGTQGETNNSEFTVVSLTFDKADGELVRSYIKRNEQAGVVKAVLDYVREHDA